MPVTEPDLPWSDPAWAEPGDNHWQRVLRLQQSWWRAERAHLPAGPMVGGTRLVCSMLPKSVDLQPNLMTEESVNAATEAIAALKAEKRPGIIQVERLRRNLLSSQPLCFNLFGYLSAHTDALLPWVRTYRPHAALVEEVKLEWAPLGGLLGGSAFDAWVCYQTSSGAQGFLGIECKYAEDLASAQRRPASNKYLQATKKGPWRAKAEKALDRSRLRQFWYNQLLTQRVLALPEFDEGIGVVVACAGDVAARTATADVAAELDDPGSLRFDSIENVVASVVGHDPWREAFEERYLGYHQVETRLAPATIP